ncbi:hypothetical protein [Lentibacillus sp. Marseille-P4043]|uniref:hypothetical protein n=1 Tax=Lentibacillus sp. Marseille-P4043 TaxID=2040293 RepID=UPI000D0B5C33|nr:hypothetical protein [Lentibacillus sp. Marseille-P4043]
MKLIRKISTTVIILTLLFIVQTSGIQTASAIKYNSAENHTVSVTSVSKVNPIKRNKQTETAYKSLSKKVIAKTNKFMTLLVQKTDDYYKVRNYQTKEELSKAFKKVASEKVAKKYIDAFYNEQPDGLYIVPTETPAWFNEKNDFRMIQLKQNQAKVIQHNSSDLHGNYTIELIFTYSKDDWKITNIDYSY